MARDEAPPFARGETYYGGQTIDTANLPTHLEGKLWVFEDIDLASTATGAKSHRSGRKVECMVVRNVSAITLLPKRIVRFQATAGTPVVGRVDGYTRLTAADAAGVVDDFLSITVGVPVNDFFWLVRKGPALINLSVTGSEWTNITTGAVLVALTAAASTAATLGATTGKGGQPQIQDLTGATQLLAEQVQNRIGRAMSSIATTQVATLPDVLVDVTSW